jgi:hypothetical protein
MVVVLDSPRAAAPVSRWRTTPARPTTNLVILLVIMLGFGTAGIIGAIQRTSAIGDIRGTSGPLAVDAQLLYRSLSDANATESSAFLAAGAEPPALRTRYLDDIAAATEALTAISASNNDTDDLRALAGGLPTYTGLVETARADNRLGLPLGAAYLREASGEMTDVLLPAAEKLYKSQSAQLKHDGDAAGGFPWIAIPLGLIALIGLVRAQRRLARRTHRVLNVGLVAATVIVAITAGWIAISWTADSVHLSRVAAESRRTDILVAIRIDVLNARADESLTLIARGNGQRYDNDFAAIMKDLYQDRGPFDQATIGSVPANVSTDIRTAADALEPWQHEDAAMRKNNDAGKYSEAVAATIGTGKDDAPALFGTVDAAIGRSISGSDNALNTAAGQADDSMTGLAAGVAVLTLIALAAMAVGFQRRIAEYR